jgi:hypothetical protein
MTLIKITYLPFHFNVFFSMYILVSPRIKIKQLTQHTYVNDLQFDMSLIIH